MFLDQIDNTLIKIGKLIAFIQLLLIAVVLAQVILRYGFSHGSVALEELMWHLYAVIFMAALSYGLVTDTHVRVDIFHRHFSLRKKALIEVFGLSFLLVPFVLIVIDHSIDWWLVSWHLNESSDNPTGLPYRWLIKGVIPLAFFLLLIAAFTRLIRNVQLAFGRKTNGS